MIYGFLNRADSATVKKTLRVLKKGLGPSEFNTWEYLSYGDRVYIEGVRKFHFPARSFRRRKDGTFNVTAIKKVLDEKAKILEKLKRERQAKEANYENANALLKSLGGRYSPLKVFPSEYGVNFEFTLTDEKKIKKVADFLSKMGVI